MKILQSPHLQLIPLLQEHEAEFTRLSNIPEINQRAHKPMPFHDVHFSELWEKMQNNHSRFIWMIACGGKLIGVISHAASSDPRIFQGDYWFEPAQWGKGYASMSLTLVKDFLFTECGAQRVQAIVEPDNHASIRVLEKCGYQREGLLQKFYPSVNRGLLDVLMYSVVR